MRVSSYSITCGHGLISVSVIPPKNFENTPILLISSLSNGRVEISRKEALQTANQISLPVLPTGSGILCVSPT